MATPATALQKLRKIALSLPDTEESETWGKPHFRVNNKIFCGYGEENGKTCVGCKLEKKHAFSIAKKPGYWLSPFGGRHGWISMDVSAITDWNHFASLIRESYLLIAPKRSQLKLNPAESKPKPSKKKAGRK